MRYWLLIFAAGLISRSQLSAGTVEGRLPAFAPPVTLQSVERYPTDAKPVMPDTFYQPPSTVVYLVSVSGQKPKKFESPPSRPKVVQINRRFIPEVLPVVVGTTVDFPNFDPFFHNAFSYSKTKKFDLGRYPTGKSRSVTFDKPGAVRVFCEIHSDMNCVVLVLENPYFAYADGEGRFKIDNVPEGEYLLKIWHKTSEWGSRGVKISEEKSANVDFRESR
jgi:plastocyanin